MAACLARHTEHAAVFAAPRDGWPIQDVQGIVDLVELRMAPVGPTPLGMRTAYDGHVFHLLVAWMFVRVSALSVVSLRKSI